MDENALIAIMAATIYAGIKGNPPFTIDLNGQTVMNMTFESECRKRSIERARKILSDVNSRSSCHGATVSQNPAQPEQIFCDVCRQLCTIKVDMVFQYGTPQSKKNKSGD